MQSLHSPKALRLLWLALISSAWLAVAGCSSTKISEDTYTNPDPLPKPQVVYVYKFAFSPDQVTPEQAIGAKIADLATGQSLTEEEMALGNAVAEALAEQLVEGLKEIGLPAELAPGPDDTGDGEGVVMIEGQFVKIDEGNRLRRFVVGLGVGKSVVNTQVQVFDVTSYGRVSVASFSTTSRSGWKPGAGETGAAGVAAGATVGTAAAVSGGVGAAAELGQNARADARRTAKLITRHLAGIAYQHGWITKEAAAKAHAAADDDDS